MENEIVKAGANEIAHATPSASVFSSESFDHAQRVAKMLSSSDLVPANYKGNIANTMIALEMAHRTGASPLMVMQNLHVIQGKPNWSSPFIIAALNSCGLFTKLKFKISGEGDEYGCVAYANEKSTGDYLESEKVTWKMVKDEGWSNKAGSKWKTMPGQMFRYRAAAFFGRVYAPELLMGMQTMEEVQDVKGPDLPAIDDLRELFELKRDELTEAEIANANRIIDNKETNSYNKLFRLLQSK